jgi:hypothetical protein
LHYRLIVLLPLDEQLQEKPDSKFSGTWLQALAMIFCYCSLALQAMSNGGRASLVKLVFLILLMFALVIHRCSNRPQLMIMRLCVIVITLSLVTFVCQYGTQFLPIYDIVLPLLNTSSLLPFEWGILLQDTTPSDPFNDTAELFEAILPITLVFVSGLVYYRSFDHQPDSSSSTGVWDIIYSSGRAMLSHYPILFELLRFVTLGLLVALCWLACVERPNSFNALYLFAIVFCFCLR